MQTDLQTLSDQQVIEYAAGPNTYNLRWLAIDELSRRALEDGSLLDAACAAIGQDRTIKVRYSPYGSWMAVGRILDSNNEIAIRLLLYEMDRWSAQEQKDAIGPWAGYKNIMEATQKLTLLYSWNPKYTIDT